MTCQLILQLCKQPRRGEASPVGLGVEEPTDNGAFMCMWEVGAGGMLGASLDLFCCRVCNLQESSRALGKWLASLGVSTQVMHPLRGLLDTCCLGAGTCFPTLCVQMPPSPCLGGS